MQLRRSQSPPRGSHFSGRSAVSPIIAMILLVAIAVVLSAVSYVLVSGLAHGANTPSIGTALVVGDPSAGQCWAAGVASHVCGTAGDRLWNLTVEHSDVMLGDILIEVRSPQGSVYQNTLAAGFAVMMAGGTTPIAYYSIAASAGLAMKNGFTYAAGYSSSTKVSSAMFLVVGTGTPASSWVPGAGNYVTIVGTNHYSGATAPAVLP
jgi:flagellin-like protein